PRPGAAAGTPARHPRREPRSGLPAARGAAAGDAPARSGGPPHRGTGTGPHPAALRTDGAVVARRRRQPLRGGRPPRDRRGGTGGPARWPRVPRRARPGTPRAPHGAVRLGRFAGGRTTDRAVGRATPGRAAAACADRRRLAGRWAVG